MPDLASAQPGDVVSLTPDQVSPLQTAKAGDVVTLSPEESRSAGVLDPIRDMTPDELHQLQAKDPKNFDLLSMFQARPDLQKDPAMVAKVADAFHEIRKPFFEGVTLKGAAGAVAKTFTGLARSAASATGGTTLILNSLGKAAIPGATEEQLKEAEEDQSAGRSALANVFSSAESSMFGLVSGAKNLVGRVGRGLGISKSLDDYTPEDKVRALYDALAIHKTAESLASGSGAVSQAITQGVPEQQPNPEEVAKLTDPFSWWALGGATKIAGAAIPATVSGAVKAGLETAGEKLAQGTGTIASAVPTAGAATLEGAAKVAPVLTLPGVAYAAATGHPGALMALLFKGGGGKAVAEALTGTAAKLRTAADFAKQVSGASPMRSAYAQAIRDTIASTPSAAVPAVEGAAFDLAQLGSAQTPQEREGAVGLGTAFGLAGAGLRSAKHILSGQIIAPRFYDIKNPAPGTGNFPELNAIHNNQFDKLTPQQKAWVNGTRLFLSQAAPGNDLFVTGDAPVGDVADALQKSGVNPELALETARQGNGTINFPNGKRLVVVKDAPAAPHEALHAIEDVLGESTLRDLDEDTRQRYAATWEQFGRNYAARLLGRDPGEGWRDSVLDASGWGRTAAVDKLYRQYYNQFAQEARSTGNSMPSPAEVRNAVTAGFDGDWRSVLTPEEVGQVADRYVAREHLAENFDAWFKHAGPTLEPGKQIPERVARAVGQTLSALGINPLAGRETELGITPNLETVRQLRTSAQPLLPTAAPKGVTAPAVIPRASAPKGPGVTQPPADTTAIAANTPDTKVEGATLTQRDISTRLANATQAGQGVRLVYRSAPGEPAAAPAQSRVTRRAIIEYARTMPDRMKPLFEKLFFPWRADQQKNGDTTWGGWVPEVFGANANRMAQWAAETGNEARIPYAIDTANKTFTNAGWQNLYNDLQAFVHNQMAGRTGSGTPLVVPKEVAGAGGYAPELGAASERTIGQREADFISMLFGTGRLPDTARISNNRMGLPLSIAGEEVSKATMPGRTQPPVVPRGTFSGEKAKQMGIEGREIQEVNPLRAELEAQGNVPKMLEAYQNLNLRNILHAEPAPEQPRFSANTLTLSAGFLPREKAPVEIEGPDGKKYKATFDGHQDMTIIGKGMQPQFTLQEDVPGVAPAKSTTYGLSLEKAGYKVPAVPAPDAMGQFRPSDNPRALRSAAVRDPETGQVFEGPFHAMAIAQAMGLPQYKDVTKDLWNSFEHGFTTNEGEFLDREQSHQRAAELDQLMHANVSETPSFKAKGGIGIEHLSPDTLTRMREQRKEATGQFQPPDREKYFKEAKDYFGVTKDPNEAGYVLPDGTMLDFSGRSEMPRSYDRVGDQFVPKPGVKDERAGKRDMDHRTIGYVPSGIDMIDFLKLGAMRVSTLGGGIHLERPPTEAQLRALQDIAAHVDDGELHVDVNAQDRKASFDGSNAKKIAGQIRRFYSGRPTGEQAQFRPSPNDEVRQNAEDYTKSAELPYTPHTGYEPVNEERAKAIADQYEAAKHEPESPKVRQAYDAFKDETLDQWNFLTGRGVKFEPWTEPGQPYASSAEMAADVRGNKHLWYFPTESGFGETADRVPHPLLEETGESIDGKPVLYNDAFRAVHDYFGHAKEGYEFGPRGEYNAYLTHSRMYSPEARPAMAAETLGQNSWVNYGKHLRDAEGAIAKKGEPGYLAPQDRPFAEQKATTLPVEILADTRKNAIDKQNEIGQTSQYMARKSKQDFELKESPGSLFSKAWVLPNGRIVQLGGQWHHEWVNQNPDIAKRYGLKPTTSGEENRVDALKKGFARINYERNTGTLKVEARASDWHKLAPSIKELVGRNLPKIDNMDVHLLDDKAKKIVDSDGVALHTYDADEKMDHIPLITEPSSTTTFSAQAPAELAKSGQFMPMDRNSSEDDIRTARNFWITNKGITEPAWSGHEGHALEFHMPEGWQPRGERDIDQVYQYMLSAGHVRGVLKKFPDELQLNGRPWSQLSVPTQKEITRLSNAMRLPVSYNGREVEGGFNAQFKPSAPKPDEFKSADTLPKALAKPNWAILTATKEALGKGTDEVNRTANENLEKALIAEGFNPIPVQGNYRGEDQGKNFLVTGMTPQQALTWGRKYGQESVLTPAGLLYGDGSLNPTLPGDLTVGDKAKKQDFYSQIEGGPAFSMGIDFSKRIPAAIETGALPGFADEPGTPKTRTLSSLEKGNMTMKDVAEHFPESVKPKKKDEAIPSAITDSPLYKEAGSEPAAINSFADRLVDFAKQYMDHPAFEAGMRWYDNIAPQLKKHFGKTAQLFAELLAATSPGQKPDTNFADALSAHDMTVAGKYDKKAAKLIQGLDMVENGKWEGWLKKNGRDLPANPTPETFLGQWIDYHDLKPRKENGALYGYNSVQVLKVAARRWLQEAGPKTSNFIQNLLGTGHEATIDLWADRTMRWAGYEGKQDRWRILPENKAGVSDEDFAFAQKVFSVAAKKLDMRADQLQGALWFAEKQRWHDNGWAPLDLGTYEPEFGKIEQRRAKTRQEIEIRKRGESAPPPLTGEQIGFNLEPKIERRP